MNSVTASVIEKDLECAPRITASVHKSDVQPLRNALASETKTQTIGPTPAGIPKNHISLQQPNSRSPTTFDTDESCRILERFANMQKSDIKVTSTQLMRMCQNSNNETLTRWQTFGRNQKRFCTKKWAVVAVSMICLTITTSYLVHLCIMSVGTSHVMFMISAALLTNAIQQFILIPLTFFWSNTRFVYMCGHKCRAMKVYTGITLITQEFMAAAVYYYATKIGLRRIVWTVTVPMFLTAILLLALIMLRDQSVRTSRPSSGKLSNKTASDASHRSSHGCLKAKHSTSPASSNTAVNPSSVYLSTILELKESLGSIPIGMNR